MGNCLHLLEHRRSACDQTAGGKCLFYTKVTRKLLINVIKLPLTYCPWLKKGELTNESNTYLIILFLVFLCFTVFSVQCCCVWHLRSQRWSPPVVTSGWNIWTWQRAAANWTTSVIWISDFVFSCRTAASCRLCRVTDPRTCSLSLFIPVTGWVLWHHPPGVNGANSLLHF